MRIVGLMSGTSLDGMDAALVDVRPRGRDGYGARLIAFTTVRYADALRSAIAAAAHGKPLSAGGLAALDAALADAAVRAVERVCRRAGESPRRVELIGSHGQTIFHGPAADGSRTTVQIGSPARIAARTGIAVVGDFRTADVALGGEGAPLMPLVHRMLFAHPLRRRIVQNIGGIGNATWIGPGGTGVRAFDTGPGVMLIDEIVRLASRGRLRFDRAGRMARRGRIDEKLLGELLRDPYLARRPPKSTGRERFGAAFARGLRARGRRRGLGDADLVATATAFTAASIADQIGRFLHPRPGVDEVLVAGGGARNPALLDELSRRLSPLPVRPVEHVGGNGDALEAIGFAILARAAVDGVRFDLRAITGGPRSAALGVLAPAGARVRG